MSNYCEITITDFGKVIVMECQSNQKQRLRSPKRSGTTPLGENDVKSNQDDIKYSNRMDIYSDSNENAIKINDDPTSEDDRPPRLPPRPPPRPRNTINSESVFLRSLIMGIRMINLENNKHKKMSNSIGERRVIMSIQLMLPPRPVDPNVDP
ncbi:CLUMA_CG009806, isoform A [Clunio marinus]|uniref:CLUMA_CG009806, isoform A n=1 Tax=Clunio marinus TaxID=568069 RepID=A0A1J1I7Y4_9DIPT|nr:CLUMA_CG009806, isoform A [Clunio marinus]